MTKEELKKKAEESLDKMVTDKGIILGCHEGFCYDEVTDFMAEFAEPREKRITELEKEKDRAWWEGFDTCKAKAGEANVELNDEIEKLKKQLEELPDKWCRNKDDYCPHLAKLEKENAELRARLNAINLLTPELQKCSKLKRDQLTKAKELLKWFVWYFREGSPNLVPYKHKVTEAEQFIKDIEVEK